MLHTKRVNTRKLKKMLNKSPNRLLMLIALGMTLILTPSCASNLETDTERPLNQKEVSAIISQSSFCGIYRPVQYNEEQVPASVAFKIDENNGVFWNQCNSK